MMARRPRHADQDALESPRLSAEAETAEELTAVNLLLSHLEEAVAFIGEMFGYKHCLAEPYAAGSLEGYVKQAVAFSHFDAEYARQYQRRWKLKLEPKSPPCVENWVSHFEDQWKGDHRLNPILAAERERLPLLVRWQSGDFVHHAVEQTILEAARDGRHTLDLTAQAVSRYLDLLARRETLLSQETLRPLLQAVAAEAEDTWGRLADRGIDKAERAADTVVKLARVCSTRQWKLVVPKYVEPALERLRRLALKRNTMLPAGTGLVDDEAGRGQLDATPSEAEVVDDDVHAKLARKIRGNARAVLLYLASRVAVCADTARTRDCIAAGLTAAGVDVSENTPRHAVASLRTQGKAVGLDLVESADCGVWLTPAGQRVAAIVPKPATGRMHSAPILNVRGGVRNRTP